MWCPLVLALPLSAYFGTKEDVQLTVDGRNNARYQIRFRPSFPCQALYRILWFRLSSGKFMYQISVYLPCDPTLPELSHPLDLHKGKLEGVVPLEGHPDEVPQVVEPGGTFHVNRVIPLEVTI